MAGDAAARAIDPRTAWIMDDILRGVATYGTAARARVLLKRNDIAGKTGTTNESVDAWFSGYTPSLVATSWLGFDQPKSLGSRETGGGVAMPIWVDYMQTALKGVPEEKPRPARTASSSRTANTISRNSRRDRRWPAWACRKPTRWASSSTAWAAAARTTASRWRRASAPRATPLVAEDTVLIVKKPALTEPAFHGRAAARRVFASGRAAASREARAADGAMPRGNGYRRIVTGTPAAAEQICDSASGSCGPPRVSFQCWPSKR